MRVTKGGVGDQRARLGQHPLSELLRSQLCQEMPATRHGISVRQTRQGRRRARLWLGPAGDLGVAVDYHIADEGQQPGRPVPARLEAVKLRRVVDKARGDISFLEIWMGDQRFKEPEVCRHAAD